MKRSPSVGLQVLERWCIPVCTRRNGRRANQIGMVGLHSRANGCLLDCDAHIIMSSSFIRSLISKTYNSIPEGVFGYLEGPRTPDLAL